MRWKLNICSESLIYLPKVTQCWNSYTNQDVLIFYTLKLLIGFKI